MPSRRRSPLMTIRFIPSQSSSFKVTFSGAVRFKYAFKGWGGVVQNNLKIGLSYTNWVVLPDKVQPKLFCGCFIYMQIFQLSVTFIVSFLLITNLSYVRILLLLSLTVILLKMYVEAYKTSVKLNVKSKVVFFSRYAFFSLCLSSQFACCHFLSSYDG